MSCPRATRSASSRTDGPPPSFAHEATTPAQDIFGATRRVVKSNHEKIRCLHGLGPLRQRRQISAWPLLTEKVVPSLTVTEQVVRAADLRQLHHLLRQVTSGRLSNVVENRWFLDTVATIPGHVCRPRLVKGLGRLGTASGLSLPKQVQRQPGLDRPPVRTRYTVFCIFR